MKIAPHVLWQGKRQGGGGVDLDSSCRTVVVVREMGHMERAVLLATVLGGACFGIVLC